MPGEPRVFPVGRLDYDTEGLLLLTNDGDLAQRLAHPSHGVEKAYLAEVDGRPERQARSAACATGSSSTTDRPRRREVRSSCRGEAGSALEIVIHEGRNRQVRRMCEAIGHPVRRLVRTRIGPVARSGSSARGSGARCATREVRALYAAAVGGPETGKPVPEHATVAGSGREQAGSGNGPH